MSANAPTAEEITRASKSNLALAFIALPRERRQDISTFYAFCRVVDDIADDPGPSVEERQRALEKWRQALGASFQDEPPLASAVRALIAKYHLPREHFLEIIAGVEMDLLPVAYGTWNELRLYCHRVASVVGLVSIEIFGCKHGRCRQYALELGLALQLTNIIRDVGEDFANSRRVYLPAEDLARFHLTADDLENRCEDERFRALLQFEAGRARAHYAAAVAAAPAGEGRALLPAEIMRAVYSRLLRKMERDGFQVLTKRYRLTALEKLSCIAGAVLRSAWPGRRSAS